jgi:hypothetical protein
LPNIPYVNRLDSTEPLIIVPWHNRCSSNKQGVLKPKKKEVRTMKSATALLLPNLLLAASLALAVSSARAEGVILRDPCQMKFPTIQKDARKWDRPALEDAGSADILYFYWACDYDPTDCCP